MVNLGIAELALTTIISVLILPFILYPAICIGLIAKKLGFSAWLFGILYLIPVVNLVAIGVLAFSKTKQAA